MTEFNNFLRTFGEPTAYDSDLLSLIEENPFEAWVRDGRNEVFNILSSCLSGSDIVPNEVSGHGPAHGTTSTEVSNVGVPPPQPEVSSVSLELLPEVLDGYIGRPTQTFSNTLPMPVSALGEVSSHGVAQEEISTGVSYVELMDFEASPQPKTSSSNNLGHLKDYFETFSNNMATPVCAQVSFPVDTDGGIPLFAQVAPIPAQFTPAPSAPSRSQSVIVQGPALADKLSTIQPQCGNPMNTGVRNTEGGLPFVVQVTPIPVQISPAPSACSAPGGKKVPKGNPERCRDYRKRQKTKKEKEEQELRQLDAKNRALKAKETVLRNKIRRIKEAARRMGLGNYFN